MKNNIFANRLDVKVEGLNLKRLVKDLIKKGVRLYNLKIESHKELFFSMDSKHKKQLLDYKNKSGYDIKIKKAYGFAGVINFFRLKVGFLIGLVLGIIFLAITSNFVWNIEVYGCEDISSDEIMQVLSSQGVEIGSNIDNVDVKEIEDSLQKNLTQISLVSVIKKGSSVIINIKETLDDPICEVTEFVALKAEYDCVITNINVVQGTAVVSKGDILKKGDTLVEPYFITEEGTKTKVSAIAEIYANIWYNEKIEINTQSYITVRSGNYVENSYLITGENESIIKENNNPYASFEQEENIEYLFYNNLLPLKIKKVRIYELIEVENSFSKESAIEKAKTEATLKAEEKVEAGQVIANTFTSVTTLQDKIIVYAYAEVNLKIGVY